MYLKRCRFGYFYDEENRTIYEHRGNILEMNGREKYLLTTIYYRYTVIIHRRKAYSLEYGWEDVEWEAGIAQRVAKDIYKDFYLWIETGKYIW